MFLPTLTLLILLYFPSNVLTATTKATTTTTASSEKLFCSTCSYEYTFEELRNQSTWLSPWSRCENQTSSTSKFGATACHTLLRIDYARQYVTIYYNASYRSVKKLPDDDRRVVLETIMSTNGSRAQFKAFYECSFEDNCHLPLDQFLQLRGALTFANYNHTNLIRRLNQFYSKPKAEVYTYFHADTLTNTLNSYCGEMSQFDKESLKTVKPKCLKKKDKLKSTFTEFDKHIKATVYACNGPENKYCNNEKKLKEFLHGVTLTDYVQKFFGWQKAIKQN
ncbi:unnamed protein product [Rotaria magnacalcarata]|uniref:Uncharacterized protein n=2 Tax=Rotaria magnacalcarata TaxID=392030 RepID=A0A814FM64_9BILA|nr:unnamed protein product [Rotaria magnacalcarata]CAF1947520.1 unnamed protein product [Rotaria magnacalcarata]CAF4093143.1 unnamed protein product [Rotaria magnacalcarata]